MILMSIIMQTTAPRTAMDSLNGLEDTCSWFRHGMADIVWSGGKDVSLNGPWLATRPDGLIEGG